MRAHNSARKCPRERLLVRAGLGLRPRIPPRRRRVCACRRARARIFVALRGSMGVRARIPQGGCRVRRRTTARGRPPRLFWRQLDVRRRIPHSRSELRGGLTIHCQRDSRTGVAAGLAFDLQRAMLEPSIAAAIAWKTSLLLAVIGLIATLAARQSAARRHFLWTCALAFSLSMPIAVISVPTYVHLTLPWGAADRWARDVPAFVTAPAREAGAVSEVHSQRPIEFASAARPTRSIWRTAMTVWLVGALLVMLRNALAHVVLIRWVRKARPDLSPACDRRMSAPGRATVC